MKRTIILLTLAFALNAYAQWSPVGDHIKTTWGENLDPNNVLPEYPRPVMERGDWMNLNGLWNYAILDKDAQEPTSFDGKILVPFAVESSLSGVGKNVGKDKELWYEREFVLPKKWSSKHVLINFGAVDYKCDVWVNDKLVCSHEGGFTSFSADISTALYETGTQKIVVRVWDPTDEGYQPRGKQVNNPNGIWYTPVTGIWQTVWLEPVGENYLKSVRIVPDIDNHTLVVEADPSMPENHAQLYVTVYDGKKKVAIAKSKNDRFVSVKMPENMKLWTPDTPFLYNLKVELKQDMVTVDEFKSYAAMRKISSGKDKNGTLRLCLNNKPIFMFGPLDQGWWPDGLYTAPTDEALKYDLQKTKDFGFNMIRKHIKVEPARWYTYCDQMGILVWQDMPSGNGGPKWQNFQYFDDKEYVRSQASEDEYRKEWKEIINQLFTYPCIAVWVPFNEAWGQFKTKEIADWTKHMDPTRLVNSASGGNHYHDCGDIFDIHHYSEPGMPLSDPTRVNVLGEYGGIGLVLKDHIWSPDRNWGYVQYKSTDEVTDVYVKYTDMLKDLVAKGYSAAVYTQTTDVEIEVNGLMTYDRKVVKINESKVHDANQSVIKLLDE